MEAIEYPVILNIYELTPPTSNGEDGTTTSVSFLSRLLKPIGLGTYHTSLEVNGYCYTFSVAGIQKSSAANKASHVPRNGSFKESVKLASLSESMDQNKINECINRLRQSFFKGSNYHLACRNCNHFTETFAMTLVLADHQLLLDSESDGKNSSNLELKTYPKWVNRLAKSGSGFLDHDDVCDVMNEAKSAAGVEGKVGWGLSSSTSKAPSSSVDKNSRSKKKTLTEDQKKALAKLRKK
mmetsp:Transcript_11895/g.18064  ORF Transcript_11895/g.18064 Transcript_11895/m.18064 type:complete len:239 (-) Transcript_11895:156-872(-)